MNLLRLGIELLPTLLRLLPIDRDPGRGRRLMLVAALGGFAAVLAAVALGFLIDALDMALATVMEPPAAAAVTAVILLLLAAVLVLGMVAAREQPPRRRVRPVVTQTVAIPDRPHPLRKAARGIEARPLQSVLFAAAAGAIVAWLDRRRR